MQIFQRPSSENEVNKLMLKELKRIRKHLRRAERKQNQLPGDSSSSDSDSEPEKSKSVKEKDQPPNITESVGGPVAASPVPVIDEEPQINDDPDNPPWIHDPELGDGEVIL